MKILNDLSVDFYLKLKKNEVDKTKFSLCLDIAERPMSIIVECHCTPTIQFSQPHQEIHCPNQSPNENEAEIPNTLENYQLEMPTCDNASMSFAFECVVEGLEDDFDEQLNNVASNSVQSYVRGRSTRNDAGINSVNKYGTFENTNNHRIA